MPLLEINRHPSPTELRWSGGAHGRVRRRGRSVDTLADGSPDRSTDDLDGQRGPDGHLPWSAAAPLGDLAQLGWLYRAFPIGWTLSHPALAATYFLVLTPIARSLRVVRGNPLQRRPDRAAPSY